MAIHELDAAPNLTLLYGKAAAAGLAGGGDTLPADELLLPDVTVDRDRLAAYDRVCGFRYGDQLPATYPHVLAFPLSVSLMAARSFPFALAGLVHIGNRITQHRAIDAAEPLTLRVATVDLRPHAKGRQFDVVTTATVGEETVWEEASTYLRREETSSESEGGSSDSRRAAESTEPPTPTARWRVPADIGRRYAAVSGDRNPIHLHPLTAKVFGFRRPIAHGMWTKARALAALEGRLPTAMTVDVAFKLPVLLPADVAFSSRTKGDTWVLGVHDAHNGRPHLQGTVHAH